jgi:hypothetical protein
MVQFITRLAENAGTRSKLIQKKLSEVADLRDSLSIKIMPQGAVKINIQYFPSVCQVKMLYRGSSTLPHVALNQSDSYIMMIH